MRLPNPYEWKHYRFYMLAPLALILLSAFFIPRIPAGIDLKGGLLITVFTDDAVAPAKLAEVQAALAQFNPSSIRTFDSPGGRGVEIELPSDENLARGETLLAEMNELNSQYVQLEITQSPDAAAMGERVLAKARELNLLFTAVPLKAGVTDAVEQAQQAFLDARSSYRERIASEIGQVLPVKDASFKEVGSSLSKFFLAKTQEVIFYSFLLSGIIIFLVFRSIAPSFAVIFGAAADIIITAGVMGALGIPLTLASIAALLMLIGFSLDTDVLLTVRVLKSKEGTRSQRAFEAMKTGFMMNVTTLAAFGVLLALASWLQIPFYMQVGSVAVIGGFVDFIATWMGNAPFLLWYLERKERKAAEAGAA